MSWACAAGRIWHEVTGLVGVAGQELGWGTLPRGSGRQLDRAGGEQRQGLPVGIGRRQGELVMRVTISVTRPATLISASRIVSNWALRQNEVLGANPRRVWSSQ